MKYVCDNCGAETEGHPGDDCPGCSGNLTWRASASTMFVGNSFPMSLVTTPVLITPVSLAWLIPRAAECAIVSLWGHENTRKIAEKLLCVSLKPATERPALVPNPKGKGVALASDPTIGSTLVYLLTPSYRPGFRPAIGVEVTPADILGWTALKVEFLL